MHQTHTTKHTQNQIKQKVTAQTFPPQTLWPFKEAKPTHCRFLCMVMKQTLQALTRVWNTQANEHTAGACYLFISKSCSRVDRSSRRLICLWQWVQKNSSASDWRKLWKLAGKELGLRRNEETGGEMRRLKERRGRHGACEWHYEKKRKRAGNIKLRRWRSEEHRGEAYSARVCVCVLCFHAVFECVFAESQTPDNQ